MALRILKALLIAILIGQETYKNLAFLLSFLPL
jgi:hypothetical protein